MSFRDEAYRDFGPPRYAPYPSRSASNTAHRNNRRSRSPPRGPRLGFHNSAHFDIVQPYGKRIEVVDSIEIHSRPAGRRANSRVVSAVSTSQGGGAQMDIISRADRIATGAMIGIAGEGNDAINKAVDIARAHSSMGEVAVIVIPLETPRKGSNTRVLFASDGSSVHSTQLFGNQSDGGGHGRKSHGTQPKQAMFPPTYEGSMNGRGRSTNICRGKQLDATAAHGFFPGGEKNQSGGQGQLPKKPILDSIE